MVTRPEPGAGRTAVELAARGFQPILLPLSATVALPVETGTVFGDAVAVAVTSANAVRHAPKELIARLAALPCHAVGARTAEAARAAGFSSVSEGSGDAGALADRIAAMLAGRTVIYLCGRVRLPGFEERLRAAGVGVRPIETYDTVALDHAGYDIAARLGRCPVGAVLLYSARAAEAVRDLMKRPDLEPFFAKTMFLCMSARVAAALGGIPPANVRVATEPNEDALLSLLG